MNYEQHYTDLARRGHIGYGIDGYYGVARYQRGHGFFGNMFKKAVTHLVPALKYVGKNVLKQGLNVASDMMNEKKSFSEAAKERLEEGVRDMANEGLEKTKQYLGSGRKRKDAKSIKGAKRSRDMLHLLEKL